MTERDRVVLWVLAIGTVAAPLTWHYIGHWLALEAPRTDLDRPEGREHRGAETAQRIDQ